VTGYVVRVGDEPPALSIQIVRTFIVAAAIASRDYEDVHHDPGAAKQRGLPDIFTNITTTNGLVARFITDWTGPAARLRRICIRLGRPNHPGDTLTLTGRVTAVPDDGPIEVKIAGRNSLGLHVSGLVTFEWAVAQ
jgi:acyl dehydratase